MIGIEYLVDEEIDGWMEQYYINEHTIQIHRIIPISILYKWWINIITDQFQQNLKQSQNNNKWND